ncbi:MAG: collagen-like protein [Muricauda sp.]|nr:collagen-like protein [Allomuricauda sp.]
MKKIRLVGMAVFTLALVLGSCSGEDGKDGLPGKDGINGTNGQNGANGADGVDGLNGADGSNGIDGIDGQDGVDGMDGQDSPNVDFYFQNGFKGYNGLSDLYIVDDGGIASKNGQTVLVSYEGGNPGAERFGLMRFDGISSIITDQLVDVGQICDEAFYVNQAILYLYVQDYFTIMPDELYFLFGFYNNADDVFLEQAANWDSHDGINLWSFGSGGASGKWSGPFEGTEDYSVLFGTVSNPNATNMPGWVALPLPKGLVQTWICDETTNKGFRLRLSGNNMNTPGIEFMSSDNDVLDLRPVLVIQTEKIDLGAKSASSNTKSKDWDSLSYEEQMGPLLKFLEMRNQ